MIGRSAYVRACSIATHSPLGHKSDCELILHPSPDPHSTTWDVSVPLVTCSDVQSPLNSLLHSSYQDWITATWFLPVFRMLVYDRCSVSWILLLAWCWDKDRETVQRQRSKSSTGFLFGRVSNISCASSLIEHWMERPHDTFGSFFTQSLTLFLEATFDQPQTVTLLFRQQSWKLANERFQLRLHGHGIVFRWNWKQWSTQRDLRENWKLSSSRNI